jgi:hypothetical protein
MITDETTIFIIIILQIIGSLLAAWLTSYFTQRAKNSADAEAIGKLTDIVEEVKNKYKEENDFLRIQLDIVKDRKAQVFSEEKESIISFFAELNSWIWDKLSLKLHVYNHTNVSELANKIIEINRAYNKVNISYSKVQLLVDNQELIVLGHKLIIEILKLSQFTETACSQLERTLTSDKSMVELLVNKQFNFQATSEEVKEHFLDTSRENEKAKKLILESYNEKQLALFSSCLEIISEFQIIAKAHLNRSI